MFNLADALQEQHKYEETKKLYRETLQMLKKLYGHDHPMVAMGMFNFAVALKDQDEYEEAEQLLGTAIEIFSLRLGNENQYTKMLRQILEYAQDDKSN